MTDEILTRIYYLYCITNKTNGKIYIGQSVDPDSRWRAHGDKLLQEETPMLISRAIKKYGNDAFEFEVIAGCKNWEDANDIETLLVQQYDSQTPNGYNVAPGGINAPKSEAWKQKMREHWANPVYKQNIVEKVKTYYIAHPEAIEIKSIKNKQWRANMSEEEKLDIYSRSSKTKIGHTVSAETRRKISIANINKPSPMKDKTHSEEVRYKISKSLIGRLPNKTSFKKGQTAPKTAFKKGIIPWNKKELDDKLILDLKKSGKSGKQIAEILGCPAYVIYQRWNKIIN